jgi:hypothetical protein
MGLALVPDARRRARGRLIPITNARDVTARSTRLLRRHHVAGRQTSKRGRSPGGRVPLARTDHHAGDTGGTRRLIDVVVPHGGTLPPARAWQELVHEVWDIIAPALDLRYDRLRPADDAR